MQALRERAAAHGQSISSVANQIPATHFSEGRRRRRPFRQKTHSLGARPNINVHTSVLFAAQYRLSFPDGVILAAADAGRCDVLYSEDFTAGRRYAGIEVRNPFALPDTSAQTGPP